MSTNDNTLGMGRAKRLWELLDPGATSPEVYQMLSDIPGDRIALIISACEEFDTDFARACVLKIANDEAFTREGRNHGEIGAILHLAAVLAPVFAAYTDNPTVRNEDGSPTRNVVESMYRCKGSLETYWRDDVQEFQLQEKNRAYFVRGWAMLTFMPRSHVLLDAELDRHLTWVGSRFPDLRAHIPAIVEGGKFDKGTLDEFADRSFDPTDTHLPDGSPNQQWYADNKSRLMGYSKDGYYSIFPESVTDKLIKRYKSACVMISGVPIRVEEFIYLEHQTNIPLDQTLFMKLLGVLSQGVTMESPFAGKAALMLSDFGVENINTMGHLVSSYTPEVKAMVLKLILDHAALRKPVNEPGEDQQFISTMVAVAPVFHAFFEATYTAGNPAQPDDWSSAEWDQELEERREDAMWNAFHNCYDHITNVEMDPEAYGNVGIMVMFMRAMALTFFVDLQPDDNEEKAIVDVALITENMDAIIRNAKHVVNSRSLSLDTINNLPKS